jgi:predicted O-methyltransferase YrrM
LNPSVETSFDLQEEAGLSLGSYLRALRYSPIRSRIVVARKLFPYLFRRIARSTAEVCEFGSLENYETSYRCLARLLGHSEKVPPPGEIDFLCSIQNRGAHPGTIGLHEFLFLTAFASILAPERAIEIGTLAGFSAAVIAGAIRRQHPNRRGTLVDTIDRNTHSVVEADKPVGFQIPDIIPNFANAVRVHAPADSGIVRELAGRDELQFAFIDADHRHPSPLLDLARLTPYVRSGGWIVFHDIQWGTMGRQAVEAGQTLRWGASYGAEWLFDRWPFRKISGGNIGAIQLPDEKSALIPFALRLMRLQFEITGKDARRTPLALYQSLFELLCI